MNEKGFATILGLCLILTVALCAGGIQESESNQSYEVTDFQTEIELQNAADSGIYIAANKVRDNPDILLKNQNPYVTSTRTDYQYEFDPIKIESSFGLITVKVWGERTAFKPYQVIYGDDTDGNGTKTNMARWVKDKEGNRIYRIGYMLFSIAEDQDGKYRRRSFAYVVEEFAVEKIIEYKNKKGEIKLRKELEYRSVSADKRNKLHFMETAENNYAYKKVKKR